MNTTLTNQDYRDRKKTHFVAKHTYSYLTPDELKELRHAILCTRPQKTDEQRHQEYVNLACMPMAAARFVDNVNQSIKAMGVNNRA